ncbi:hypothetical protein CKO09_06090 [Chromatium weissei]|nr:hypothetical protein [Chromatium weissei]
MVISQHAPRIVIILTLATLFGCAGEPLIDGIPAHIARIPDAIPKVEPLAKSGNAPSYVVRGQQYHVKSSSHGYVERGLASWYGKPFHGRKTSSGEIYDMNGMSAAHKTLPLPTYARITNLANKRSIVIRINDRGPFHQSRLIDLSYTAAVKLGVDKTGTSLVEVRAIDPRPIEEPNLFLAAFSKTKAIAQALMP